MRIGLFGATGAVGQEALETLIKLNFAPEEIILFASQRSAGKKINQFNYQWTIHSIDKVDFQLLDYALFCVNGEFSKKYASEASEKNCIVIDNSSAFRYEKNIPLVIPEINPVSAKDHKIIANPNCTTAIAAIPLWIAHQLFTLKKVIISTYQATSGAGFSAMEELLGETQNYLDKKPVSHQKFSHPIPFNLIPHIDQFQENLYTKEEMKVVWETRKIFNLPDLPISCTCVRIPTLRAHSESITIETEKECSIEAFKKALIQQSGVELRDEPHNLIYPMPLTASGKWNIEVGRIRNNLIFGKNGMDFFVCGDQLLKGAALNAVQILQCIIKRS